MFGRRQKPLLSLDVNLKTPILKPLQQIQENTGDEFTLPIMFDVFVANTGRYIAKEPMLIINISDRQHKISLVGIKDSGTRVIDISDLRKQGKTYQLKNSDLIFYTQMKTRVATLSFRVLKTSYQTLSPIVIGWEAFAENMQNQKGFININLTDGDVVNYSAI